MNIRHNAHVLYWKNYVLHQAHLAKHPCWKDNNNCTVRSVKNAFGISQIRAYEECKRDGRPHGDGYNWGSYYQTVKRLAAEQGRKVDRLMRDEARRDYGKTVVSAQRRLGRGETVIFNVRGHTMSYRNGFTNDWADGRRHHIWEVWRLTS
jgi:hypothetical protein